MMNKAAVYIFLMVVAFAFMNLLKEYNDYQEIVVQKEGLQFQSIDQQSMVLWPQKNDVFFLGDETNGTDVLYHSLDPFSGSGPMNFSQYERGKEGLSREERLVKAIQGDLKVSKEISLDYAGRVALMNDQLSPDFSGYRLIQKERSSFLWYVIDSTAFVFMPFFILLAMLVVWFQEAVGNILGKWIGKSMPQIVKGIFISLFALLFYLGSSDERFANSEVSSILRIVIIVLPVYLVFQIAIKQWLANKEFADREFVKFAIIFGGSFITLVLSTWIARWVDATFFAGSVYKAIYVLPFLPMMIYFAFFIACGNLLNNLRKEWWGWRNRQKHLESLGVEALSSQSELNAIQASVNPHFLYNSLNSIASLASTDPEKTEAMAIALSDFYKYTTNRKGDHLCPLIEEVEMVKNYLEIEQIRFGDRLVFDMDLADGTENFPIPRFMLQPIVENAVKYGFDSQEKTIRIKLETERVGSDFLIRVFDTGKPFPEDINMGYGLGSVAKKLKLIYPEKHELELVNEPRKHVLVRIEG